MTEEENEIKNTEPEKGIKKEGNWFTKQSTPIKVIIGVLAICCIGVIVLFAMGAMSPDGIQTSFNFTDSSGKTTGYSTEKIGKESFKIPTGYTIFSNVTGEGGGVIVTYINNQTNNTLTITDTGQQLSNIESFATNYAEEKGSEAVKTTIGGETAYKVDVTSQGYTFYSYILNINGETYNFVIDTETPNPDEFIANLF